MAQQIERLLNVHSRIEAACQAAQRQPGTVRLLAVSKQQPVSAIRGLYEAGQRDFGENRLQEAARKQDDWNAKELCWHFIGPVQSNKTREIAARFDWVQSVDREKILQRLNAQRPETLPALNICLQVNIDKESQKAGLSPEDCLRVADLMKSFQQLRFRGLMCIPAVTANDEQARASLKAMAALYEQLVDEGHELDTLSMGMSGDLERAIDCGSTMVRIGTDLFGARTPKQEVESNP